MRVDKLAHRLEPYRYFYMTSEPEDDEYIIHKKGCPLLPIDQCHRLFIGYERLPKDALSRAEETYPDKSCALCPICSELSAS